MNDTNKENVESQESPESAVLEPCPFCKNSVRVIPNDCYAGEKEYRKWIIECCYLTFGEFDTPEQAIEVWNRWVL